MPTATGRDIIVNRYVVQKGLERQLVLVLVSEPRPRRGERVLEQVLFDRDAIRTNRTDGSMVRVIAPIAASDESGASAERVAEDFVRAIFPTLPAYLPE